MPHSNNSFQLADYTIFGISLVASAAVGFYFSFRNRKPRTPDGGGDALKRQLSDEPDSPSEVLLGGRNMPVVPTAMSLLTSFLSGITLLAMPVESYQRGVLFWFSRLIGTFVALLIASYIVLPIFYRFRPTSAYEYFQLRFGSRFLRQISAALYSLFMMFYMAIVMYAPAVALSGVTGVNTWTFVVTVGTVCIAYTSFGGLKAVVWADTLQASIMLVGVIALFFKGASDAGGLVSVLQTSVEAGRWHVMGNVSLNPFQYMTLWASIFGGIGFWLSMLTFNQIALQRYLSLPSLQDARRVIWINIPTYVLMMTFADLLGIVIYAYYQQCDPLSARLVDTKDQLVIYFALDVFNDYPGLPGLFLACLFSGTLSTVSSGINSMAAVIWEDFVCSGKRRVTSRTQCQQGRWVKGIGCAVGIASVGLAFLAEPLGGIIKTLLSIMGATAGPLVGMFILGIMFPFANKKGALAGVTVSVAITVFISVGNAIYKPYASYTLPLGTRGCSEWNISVPANIAVIEATLNAGNNSFGDDSGGGFLSYDQWSSQEAEVELQARQLEAAYNTRFSPLTGWTRIFGISDILYSTIGIILVVAVGVPVSLIDILLTRHRDGGYLENAVDRQISNSTDNTDTKSAEGSEMSDRSIQRSLTFFWTDDKPTPCASVRNSRSGSKASSDYNWYNCDEYEKLGGIGGALSKARFISAPNTPTSTEKTEFV